MDSSEQLTNLEGLIKELIKVQQEQTDQIVKMQNELVEFKAEVAKLINSHHTKLKSHNLIDKTIYDEPYPSLDNIKRKSSSGKTLIITKQMSTTK